MASPGDPSRRRLFTDAVPNLLRGVASGNRELRAAISEGANTDAEVLGTVPWAGPAKRCATAADLHAAIAEHELEDRRNEIQNLVRISNRLVPDAEPARDADTSSGVDEVRAAIRVDVLTSSDAVSSTALDPGLLLIWATFDEDAGTARARARIERSKQQHHAVDGVRVTASAEVVLPRAWSSEVEPLDLSDEERAAWESLRQGLAQLQGIAPTDNTNRSHRLHRLFGYVDDRSGRLRPQETPDGEPWELLLQVGTPGSHRMGLVTVWAPRSRLQAGHLSGLIATRTVG